MAVSTVTVVVLQLIRGNAIARAIRNPKGASWVQDDSYKACRAAVQHRPRREDDGIGHQNDELLRRQPAHAAERQLEAIPDEADEQRVDLLKVIFEAGVNFQHFDSQRAGYLERVIATTTVDSRLFGFCNTLTVRELTTIRNLGCVANIGFSPT